MTTRPEMLVMLHRNVCPTLDIGEYAMRIGHWDLLPVMVNENLAAVVMKLENEIHLTVDVPYQRKVSGWRSGLKNIIQPIIDKYGRAVTRVPFADMKARFFVEKVGFKFVSERDGIQLYMLDKLKSGSRSCRQ